MLYGPIPRLLMLSERLVRSLSVRFMEPSLSVAAATDLFHHWRQQLHKLPQGPHIRWDEPACDAAITVDFSGVAAVLCEICLQANSTGELIAAIAEADGLVIYSVREPASKKAHHDMPPEAQQWLEWERLATISGGRLERTYDESAAHTVTSLRFPSVL